MAQPLHTRLAMEGTVSGLHRSPHRGSSVEFAEYRNYVPGDDLRRLDWRVFARTDRFYLKEFEAETNLRCYLVLDGSGSMAFSSPGNPRKIDKARRLAASMAYLTVHQGDAAGLVWTGSQAPPQADIPPRRTPSHLQTLIEAIDQGDAAGPTELIPTLHALADRIRRRALVVVFSDLFCDAQELLGAVQHLRFQHHDVALFHLLDTAETEFAFDRPVRFIDLEGGPSLITEAPLIREAYLRQFQDHLDRIRQGCVEFKVEYRQVFTHDSEERILAGFLIDRLR